MRVEIAKVPSTVKEKSAIETLATLCYYYPQYTLKQARSLPHKQVKLLLKEARIQKAIEWHWLTHIMTAANSGDKASIKTLLKALKDEM